jgi:pyridoxamine 5'-phosphate oxidase
MMEMFPALNKSDVDHNPIKQFAKWYDQVLSAGIPEADAMTLATAARDGQPSARVVLLKSFDERGFVFYTNYDSRKGKELAENPRACLVAYWMPIKRQVRIEGTIEKISDEESDQYFHSRPLGSKLAAWASNQSEVIQSRAELEKEFEEFGWKFGDNIPRPPNWGGFRIQPATIEFWQGRENRLHDRLRYRLQPDGTWMIERLGP